MGGFHVSPKLDCCSIWHRFLTYNFYEIIVNKSRGDDRGTELASAHRARLRCAQDHRLRGQVRLATIGTVSNVASRLCDEAKPGQILISPRVLMKVENDVKVEPVGEFELKGIRRLLAAYNVVGVGLTARFLGKGSDPQQPTKGNDRIQI
jgi:hypothetical protein